MQPAALEGASDFAAVAASLKRRPDTNRRFLSSLGKVSPPKNWPIGARAGRAPELGPWWHD